MVPGARSVRQSTGVSTYPSAASKQTGRVPFGFGSPAAASPLLICGRTIGPMPETRRFTHSTCWVGSPEKS